MQRQNPWTNAAQSDANSLLKNLQRAALADVPLEALRPVSGQEQRSFMKSSCCALECRQSTPGSSGQRGYGGRH